MKHGILSAFISFFVILAGCAHNTEPCANCSFWENARTKSKPLAVMAAKYTSTPIKIDGCLDEAAWKNANVYPLYLPEDASQSGKALEENGDVSLGGKTTFFVGGKVLIDIVAEGRGHQLMHLKWAISARFFSRNDNFTWYWELMHTTRLQDKSLLPGWEEWGCPA
jgi:hypothetical protein